MKILMIGCGGFIGSHLTGKLLSRIDGSICGWDLSNAKLTADVLGSKQFRFVERDYARPENFGQLAEEIAAADLVINLAAICNPSQYNTKPVKVIRSNFIDAYPLVDCCAERHKWLMHFSTCEVYGRTISSYVPGEDYQNLDLYELEEDRTPLVLGPINRQRWTYACSKQLMERYIVAHHTENALNYTIVRPLNFFGPLMDFIPGVDGEGLPRVLACFMEALMKGMPLKIVDGGKARRVITDIDDAIEAIVAMVTDFPAAQNQIFNIGNPANEVSMAELAAMMRRLYAVIAGVPESSLPPIVDVTAEDFYGPGYEDCDRRMPVIDKAIRRLGWQPKIGIEETLRRTITFYWKHYAGRVGA